MKFYAILLIIGSITVVTTVAISVHNPKLNIITKQHAMDIVMNQTHCTGDDFIPEKGDGSLYHIKDNIVFFVNDTNFQDKYISSPNFLHKINSTDYVWEISYACYNYKTHSMIDYSSFVDAMDGTLLK